ncbi:serine/threonine-protein phosphatase 6 regulatory ankyrin repeat subunit C-like isoform X2 [Varroa destructor]|uniref:Uncharacterized protein n=1 Tax=Varroa destructor TaxID=109461 RepID=A0A7M7J446_VARDE|nr:serine/threonine-protein phosphatase 6 regulatory ankyrin repeat subunit C-like isoform X2 [Varroa destructor]
MISEPVVTPDALKDAITSSPRHVSKGGPMDNIYKSYVFLIQSGFGYYYTWSPFYNPGGDESGRPPEEGPLGGGFHYGEQLVPVESPSSSKIPPTTSREIPLPQATSTPKHNSIPPPTTRSRHKSSGAQDLIASTTQPNIKKIHVVRSPYVDLPPVRAMRELASLSTPGCLSSIRSLGTAEDPIALWLKLGALDKLEQALLDGYWEQLVGKTSRIPQVSRFLRQVPAVQARIEEIHEAVVAGRLDLVRRLIEHKKFAYSRDPQGATPLHKAVLYQHPDIISFFLEHYPSTLHARDHQGRTPLHYAAVLEKDPEIYDALLEHGADENATDVYGHTPTYYLESDELTVDQLQEGMHRSARCREGTLHKASRIKHRENFAINRSFSAKRAGNRSQVREMIRHGNLEVLEELVLHGHGDKLLGETSSDPVVQEFLDTVPGYMEQINDVHRAVVRGRLREVQTLISHKSLSLARDAMGLTPLHKAVLFGHYDIAEHMALNFPASMAAKSLDGRTALHLAAGLRDGQKIYDMLIFAGAPANILDSKGKNAEQYLNHPELLDLEQTIRKNQLANATYLGNTISKLKFLAPNVTKTQSVLHDRLLFSSNLPNFKQPFGGSENSDATPVTPPSPPTEDELNNNTTSNLCLGYLKSMPPQPPAAYRRFSRGRLPPVEIQGEMVTAEKLREWIEDQNVEKLHETVMSGVADQLGKDHPRDEVIQAYLRHDVPNLMRKFEAIHRALQEGNVPELESQLESQDFALARDHFGMTPLHRAVILNNVTSVKFLVNRFPETINARDREGRTALHFAAAISRRTGKNGMFRYLLQNGADNRIKDNRGRPAEYYKSHHLPIPSETALLGSRRKLRSKSEPPVRNGFRSQSLLANQISERITTALQKGSVPLAQELVIEGYGKHLVGRTSWNEELRHYLRQIPTQLVSIENLHRAASTGDVQMLAIISNRDDALLRARDENGYQAIHIATINRQPEVIEYIAKNYTQYLTSKTPNGQQPLHLAALQKDAEIYRLLVNYGADVRALDSRGRTAEFYMRSLGAPKKLATNPERFYEDYSRRTGAAPLPALGSAFSRKSMPDVNHVSRDVRTRTNSESSVISDQDDHHRLNELIDYWIKEEDLLRLEHVVIAGQGERLIGKTSSNPQVQEFLSLVPTYMDKIQQVHQAVIKGDVHEVKELLTRKRFALSRDVNGASPLHLSILYGHPDVLKYIVEFFPETLDGPDNEGRTPLHYAAVAPVIDVDYYQILRNAGADINIKDKNGNSADFYRTHPDALTIEDIFRNYEHTPGHDDSGIDSDRINKDRSPSATSGTATMSDVKQEVRDTVSNMIKP